MKDVKDVKMGHALTNLAPAGSSAAAEAPAVTTPKVCPVCHVRYPAAFKVCPRDAVELEEVDAKKEGDQFLGTVLSQTYSVVRVIGEGGMGRVYEARHTRIGSKRFAIKVLHPEFVRQPEVVSRFQREAEAAASIASPYVVDVYDVDRTPDGRPFMVGEFLEGKELAEYLREVGKLPVGPAVRIVRQICRALATAHEKGIVHRDMKPENVFLTGDLAHPVAKVIDFGISKTGDTPGTALTKTGMIMGTPSYMAPEQARGERVDHRADVYAVGAILYCALTGKRPFDRGDPTATLTAVLIEDPPRPRSIDSSIPEPLEVIVQKAMAKAASDRFQTMAELFDALAPYDPGDVDLLLPAPADGATGMLSSRAATTSRAALNRQTREVTMARPLILLMGVLGAFYLLGGIVTTIAAFVRLARGGGAAANLTGSEATLLLAGALFALLTPAVLLARHVMNSVWNNSMKAISLAERIRRPVVVGLGAYGFASLLVRFIEAVLLRRAVGVAWPVWDLLLFGIGTVASIAAVWVLAADRPRD